jgi:hypothetical protein
MSNPKNLTSWPKQILTGPEIELSTTKQENWSPESDDYSDNLVISHLGRVFPPDQTQPTDTLINRD